jgi:hypothetical protein
LASSGEKSDCAIRTRGDTEQALKHSFKANHLFLYGRICKIHFFSGAFLVVCPPENAASYNEGTAAIFIDGGFLILALIVVFVNIVRQQMIVLKKDLFIA